MVFYDEWRSSMAYFLKITNKKKGKYLQIYESFYNKEKKNTSHKSFKTLGFENDLIASGIVNPIEFYSNEVKKLNTQLKLKKESDKIKLIDVSPVRYLGYFPIKNILDGLAVSKHINLLQYNRSFHFSISDVMEALVYSRIINPASKFKSFHDVIPY